MSKYDEKAREIMRAHITPEPSREFAKGYAAMQAAIAILAQAAAEEARAEERSECAKIAARHYGGPAHTYASENAETYRAQDRACRDIAKAIRERE